MYRQALLAAALFTGAAEPPPSTGRIEGTVRDSAGVPVANAQVIVVSRPWTAMSDSLGRFRLADIPAGRYTIQVSAIGYGRREVTGVSVTAGATTRLDLTLKPSTVDEVVAQTGVAKRAEADWREMSRMVPTQGAAANGLPYPAAEPMNTENYAVIEESRFLPAGTNPRSTFSIDVDAASYTNVRRFLTPGQRPPQDAVRIEELLNYFRYDYPEPEGEDPFSVTTDLAVAPWAPEHRLLRIGIKGRSLRTESVPPSNLVFLLDVSGSMQPPNKLPLVKQAFRLLVQELRPQDRVAIVVYAGAAGLVLPSTPGSDKATILAALDRLEAGGSTAGGAGSGSPTRRPAALRTGGQQPGDPGDGRRLQRRRELRRGDGAADRGAPRPGRLPHRAGLRHGQPEGQPHGADRGQGERALRLRGQPERGPAGVRARVRAARWSPSRRT